MYYEEVYDSDSPRSPYESSKMTMYEFELWTIKQHIKDGARDSDYHATKTKWRGSGGTQFKS
eukprot:12886552-Prorocentrum_lima.AAC.1